MKLWQRFLSRVREYQVARMTPPTMAPEQFYSAMRSHQADIMLMALEQHLRTNGSFDARTGLIQKAEGPKGYWYMLGYCRAHQDLLTFLRRARRPDHGENVVEEQTAPRTGGVAKWA